MFRLSSDMIFDLLTHLQPFQIRLEKKTKVRNLILTWKLITAQDHKDQGVHLCVGEGGYNAKYCNHKWEGNRTVFC